MSIAELTKNVVELAQLRRNDAISLRRENVMRRAITETLIIKQFENTEDELVESLSPVFKKQIQDIVDRLVELEIKTFEEQAHTLASLIFDPKMWTREIINRTLPVIALNMARAGVTQLLVFGIDIRKSAIFNRKQTTASEWVERNSDDYDDLLGTFEGTTVGTATNIRFMTELPPWMKKAIMEQLAISFSQDYWEEISKTTQGDAEKVLKNGLSKGWSIRRMAKEMRESLGGDKYAKMRATRIARTESGGALNAVRTISIDKLMSELGPVIPMKKAWLSVLADSTRDDHANLDGVPADSEGLWNVGGTSVPWPGHYTLPPEQKCNCLCSVISELGMTDAEARGLIEEHEQRVSEINQDE